MRLVKPSRRRNSGEIYINPLTVSIGRSTSYSCAMQSQFRREFEVNY